MDGYEPRTDVDIQVLVVTEELNDLLANWAQQELLPPKGRRAVVSAAVDLYRDLTRLRDGARNHNDVSFRIREAEKKVLQGCYKMEYETDTFIMKRLVSQRQEGFVNAIKNALRPIISLGSVRSQINVFIDKMRSVSEDDVDMIASSDHVVARLEDEMRKEDEEQEALVAEMLCKDEIGHLCVVPVVDMGSSGESTLARRVCEREDIRRHFGVRACLGVSAGSGVRDVLVDLCKQVTGEMGASVGMAADYLELMKKAEQRLSNNRYLIVMDDVCLPQLWEHIGHVFPNLRNGSKILAIIRDKRVGGCEIVIWESFLKNLERVNGLKISKLLYHWIDEQVIIDGQDGDSNLSSGLALIYQKLPPRIRLCFLYMGLFPKEFEIPIRRLLRLWIAEGLVRSDSDKTPEDLAEDYFKELESTYMIEVTQRKSDGRPKMCRIPGALHEVFSAKAMDLGLFFVHRYSVNTSVDQLNFNVRRLAEHYNINEYPSSEAYTQYLRSYIAFRRKRDTPTVEVGVFLDKLTAKRGFALLRVLDLENVYKPKLTESLGKLLQLRYLGLRWTFLDLLAGSVGRLLYLETLDVKHTNITTLPSSIWNAKNLRHLYMNEVHLDISVRDCPGQSLTKLQTLWGLSIGNRSLVVRWLRNLVGLRKLGLTCHSESIDAIAEWILTLTDLQSLKLRSIDEFGHPLELKLADMTQHRKLSDLYLIGVLPKSPNELHLFPPNLKVLTLSGSQLAENSISFLGKLRELNILRLYGRSYSGKTIVCGQGEFPKLLVLKLWVLKELEEWKIESGAMQHLRELDIRGCSKLERVDGVENLTALNELTLTDMPAGFVKHVGERVDKAVSIKKNPL